MHIPQGKLWLEIDKWNTEFLYQTSLGAGVGSNDIGLDRGQMGETKIVRFERIGPKILLIQSNLEYRAVTSDPGVGNLGSLMGEPIKGSSGWARRQPSIIQERKSLNPSALGSLTTAAAKISAARSAIAASARSRETVRVMRPQLPL